MDKKLKKEIEDYLDSNTFKKKVNKIVTDVMEMFVDSIYSRKSQIKNMTNKY